MNLEEITQKYRAENKIKGGAYASYPGLYPMPGCCSAMVLSGFGMDWPAPESFKDYVKEIENGYGGAMLIAILLQSQMEYGKVLKEIGWEESAQISHSNYNKQNLMRVFIKSLRPIEEDEVEHAAILRAETIKRAREQKERADKLLAEGKTLKYYDMYPPAPTPPKTAVALEGCTCRACEKLRQPIKEVKVA